MPFFADTSEEDIEQLLTEGGLHPKTLKRRANLLKQFQSYVTETGGVFEELLESQEQLETYFVRFLEAYRVLDKKTKEQIRPKQTTFNFIGSMLKSELLKQTKFEDFKMVKKGMAATSKRIKEAGRAEIDHFQPVPGKTMDSVWQLCKNVEDLMEARVRKDRDAYDRYLNLDFSDIWIFFKTDLENCDIIDTNLYLDFSDI